jgi:hypothetical protein
MADLSIRPASECRFDAVSLGEVMLRLDPGEGRIRTARSFRAWEGGGEYRGVPDSDTRSKSTIRSSTSSRRSSPTNGGSMPRTPFPSTSAP